MTVWQHLMQGDSLSRLVVLVLLLMSVATWVVVIWKVWMLRRAGPSVALAVSAFWQSANPDDAMVRMRATDVEHLALPLVNAAMRVQADGPAGGAVTLAGQTPVEQRLTRLLRDALVSGQRRLQFGQVLLATVGATAPFVGLLGTVWGIYHALLGMGGGGVIGLEQVSGPVGEALVMTAAGLGVAIPAVLAYNVLGRWSAQIESALDAFAHDVRAWALAAPQSPT
jgi:biopolymer transport protein ExbB